MTCSHQHFDARVEVSRIEDENPEKGERAVFNAEIHVHCADCGETFIFFGLPVGISLVSPTMAPAGLCARLPMRPASERNQPLPEAAVEAPRVGINPWSQGRPGAVVRRGW